MHSSVHELYLEASFIIPSFFATLYNTSFCIIIPLKHSRVCVISFAAFSVCILLFSVILCSTVLADKCGRISRLEAIFCVIKKCDNVLHVQVCLLHDLLMFFQIVFFNEMGRHRSRSASRGRRAIKSESDSSAERSRRKRDRDQRESKRRISRSSSEEKSRHRTKEKKEKKKRRKKKKRSSDSSDEATDTDSIRWVNIIEIFSVNLLWATKFHRAGQWAYAPLFAPPRRCEKLKTWLRETW